MELAEYLTTLLFFINSPKIIEKVIYFALNLFRFLYLEMFLMEEGSAKMHKEQLN